MNRTVIHREVQFDAGHRVPEHDSKCRNPHGHRYRVVVRVRGPIVEHGAEAGMVMDFGRLKALLTELVHDRYDHGFVVASSDQAMLTALYAGSDMDVAASACAPWRTVVVPWVPTAENFAQAIFVDVAQRIAEVGRDVEVVQVDVWETPNCCATVVR